MNCFVVPKRRLAPAAGGPPYFEKLSAPAVREALPGPQRAQLAFAHRLLCRLHRDKDALGAAALLEALLAETGYSGVLLSQFRGDRKRGIAEEHLAAYRTAKPFDVEVDTHACTPDECAEQIIAAMRHPSAFERIRKGIERQGAESAFGGERQ